MDKSLLDFKPTLNPGYTGNRHDDAPKAAEGLYVLSFIAGGMLVMVLDLVWRAIA